MIFQKPVTRKVINNFPIIFILMSLSGLSLAETSENLLTRDGLFYKKFSNVPFTGTINEIRPQTAEEGNQPTKQVDGTHIEANYKDGKLHGQYTSYFDNGQLSRTGKYVNGKKHGLWSFYYSNGQLSKKGEYQRGQKIGVWDSYWINGNLYTRGEYTLGSKGTHGRWLDCEIDGQVRDFTSGTYQNGRKVSKALPADWKCK